MKPFELAPLPYAYDYLEPVIDAETMKLHHDKHHQAYVNNLNAAIAKYPDLPYGCVDCILGDIAKCARGHAVKRLSTMVAVTRPHDVLGNHDKTRYF